VTALQVRLVWLEAITQKFRAFMEQGGDPSSLDSFLAALLFTATADFAKASSRSA
jgi:hypothetical protein